METLVHALMWLVGIVLVLVLAIRIFLAGSIAGDLARNLPLLLVPLFLILWAVDAFAF